MPKRKFPSPSNIKMAHLALKLFSSGDVEAIIVRKKSYIERAKQRLKRKGFNKISVFNLSHKEWIVIGKK